MKTSLLVLVVFNCLSCNTFKSDQDPITSYHENGAIRSVISTINLQEYYTILYYENGKPKSILHYKNNELDGVQYWFWENGNLEKNIDYKNGNKEGKAYYYYESGTLKYERNWSMNKRVGFCHDFYDLSGEYKSISEYNNSGKLVRITHYDQSGNVVEF